MPSPIGSPSSSSRPDHEPLYTSSAEPALPCSSSPSDSEPGKEVQTTPALLEVRTLCKAAVVAGALCRWHLEAEASAPSSPSIMMLATVLQVQNVEWHSRPAQDFYAATAAVDFITFLYVVVFYQVRPGGVPPDVMPTQGLSWLVPQSCASTRFSCPGC